jgi:Di-haem oxidoreductase, putative peroxidase
MPSSNRKRGDTMIGRAVSLFCGLGVMMTPLYGSAELPESDVVLGSEVAISRHLRDDEEFRISTADLIEHGKQLFSAMWTVQEGAGRPLTKGNGRALSDPSKKLVNERSFNRISGPDANSCSGCHNAPFGLSGGGGDVVTNVFVLGQRFDFVNFDQKDLTPTSGSVDESGNKIALETVANLRSTTGIFGAGYIEMLAREITEELQRIRDSVGRGESKVLEAKGISFGRISRKADGLWDVSQVVGLPRLSLITATPLDPPTLVIRPWHQSSHAVSLREFTNTAMNHHHGIQSSERFGAGDFDGDGVKEELTRADVTALAIYQAVLPVPGQVIPKNQVVAQAIREGEGIFKTIGCAECHVPSLTLSKKNWVFTEPNPYNPPTNLREGEVPTLSVDLTDRSLPQPRLLPKNPTDEVLQVPLYSDLKLHDITDPNDPTAADPLDMNQSTWSPKFKGGNRKFLTKRLWGAANEPPYFHHGRFTTLREAVIAHHGEALASRMAFDALAAEEKNYLIEFLKSLQVLSPHAADNSHSHSR